MKLPQSRTLLACAAIAALFIAGCAGGPLGSRLRQVRQNSNAYAQPWSQTAAPAPAGNPQGTEYYGGGFQQQPACSYG